MMIMLMFTHFRREDDVISVFFCLSDRLTAYFFGFVGGSLTSEVLEEYQLAYDKFGRYGGSAAQHYGGWQRFS